MLESGQAVILSKPHGPPLRLYSKARFCLVDFLLSAEWVVLDRRRLRKGFQESIKVPSREKRAKTLQACMNPHVEAS